MLKSRLIPGILLAAFLGAFGLGVIHLFQLRFNAGDIYPPYSSLRADPLGIRAFYESLQTLPGLAVSRFYQASSKLEGGPPRVLMIAGTEPASLRWIPEGDYKALQSFLLHGGRVVISFSPVIKQESSPARSSNSSGPTDRPATRGHPSSRDHTNSEEMLPAAVSFFDKMGARLQYDDLNVDAAGLTHSELAFATDAAHGLAPSISWHSAAYFDGLDNKWRTLYRRKKHPVIVERSVGAGTLVLASDSYFLSNEALRAERHPDLLAWLVGPHREVIFDETHLGVEEHPGVATLLRRYRLEGFLLGLLLVAGLFVWKNSVPLLPPPPDDAGAAGAAFVRGRESTAGFASLLRRSIPPPDISLACFAEWKAACARQPRAAARLAELEQIIEQEKSRPARSRRPMETYRTIQRILTERK